VIVVHNFDKVSHEITLEPGVEGGERLSNLLVKEEHESGEDGIHRIALEALDYRWFRVGGLDYAINRGRTTTRKATSR
jgi:maltose alpha-D-glucosyltransferase/alpha-amylase